MRATSIDGGTLGKRGLFGSVSMCFDAARSAGVKIVGLSLAVSLQVARLAVGAVRDLACY